MTWARMWEATVADGRLDDAVDFARALTVELDGGSGFLGAEHYLSRAASSEDTVDRLVVITHWERQDQALEYDESPPFGRMFTRQHAWVFEQL